MSWWDGRFCLTLRFWPFIFKLLSFLNALSYRCEIGLEWQIISYSFCIWERQFFETSSWLTILVFNGKKQSLSFYKIFVMILIVFANVLKILNPSQHVKRFCRRNNRKNNHRNNKTKKRNHVNTCLSWRKNYKTK